MLGCTQRRIFRLTPVAIVCNNFMSFVRQWLLSDTVCSQCSQNSQKLIFSARRQMKTHRSGQRCHVEDQRPKVGGRKRSGPVEVDCSRAVSTVRSSVNSQMSRETRSRQYVNLVMRNKAPGPATIPNGALKTAISANPSYFVAASLPEPWSFS